MEAIVCKYSGGNTEKAGLRQFAVDLVSLATSKKCKWRFRVLLK